MEDPWEMNDLANDPKNAEKIKELRGHMVEYRENWDELKTHWGKYFWKGFVKDNPEYMTEEIENIGFGEIAKGKIKIAKRFLKKHLKR